MSSHRLGRWRFLDPSRPEERQRQSETDARIDAWWRALAARRADLDALFLGEAEWDLPEFVAENLGVIDHRIMWEFGPARAGDGHALVLTPEFDVALQPLVERIVARAPADIGFELHTERPAEPIDVAVLFVQEQIGIDLRAASVLVRDGEHRRFDLDFFFPGGGSKDDLEAAAYIATSKLLGEAITERWVGEVTAKGGGRLKMFSKPAAPIGSVLIGDFARTIATRIEARRAELPSAPCVDYVRDAEWSVFELDGQDAMFAQFDLFTAISPNDALFRATHSGDNFYDERFSRYGETFAYLKIDGREGLDGSKYEDRGEIEDELTEMLEKHGLGTTVGGGTGAVHSYVELALLEIDTAVEMIAKTLREGGAPRRSWIQFHRADWSREWVGVYPDAPRPPMPDDD
ncbi:MAG: hypothetical protein RMA76_37515 [Deltaproteobacteria bacterium]